MYTVYVFPNSISGLHPVRGCSDDYISPVVLAGVARSLSPLFLQWNLKTGVEFSQMSATRYRSLFIFFHHFAEILPMQDFCFVFAKRKKVLFLKFKSNLKCAYIFMLEKTFCVLGLTCFLEERRMHSVRYASCLNVLFFVPLI